MRHAFYMLTPRWLCSLCCFALAVTFTVRGGDLDAPGAKPVTLRSEIERGHAAAIEAAATPLDPHSYGNPLAPILSRNQQQRTDSDGFKLGLYFGAWQNLWKGLSLTPDADSVSGSQLDQAIINRQVAGLLAKMDYEAFRDACKRADLSNEQLKEVFVKYSYDSERENPVWEAALNKKHFAGTFPKAKAK